MDANEQSVANDSDNPEDKPTKRNKPLSDIEEDLENLHRYALRSTPTKTSSEVPSEPSTSNQCDKVSSETSAVPSTSESSPVGFPKLKANVKNRHFRRKNIFVDDVSSDEDSPVPPDNDPACDYSINIIDTTNSATRVTDDDDNASGVQDRTSSHTTDDSTNGLMSELDDSTVESVDSEKDTGQYEQICNPKLTANWFALPEIMKRQQGYSSKLNGHLQFQHRYYGSLHVAQRFELMAMLEYHDGCVNSLGFNPTGSLLASASDDLRVVIWDWAIGKRKTSWVTKHRSNIFQSKFLALSGQSELQLVTSARDGQVWLWQLGQDGLRGSRKLGQHRGASHKLTLLKDQPHVILSCGEDGIVYSHDVRETKTNKLTYVIDEEKQRVPLYSIHSHPLKSTEFCVSGHDPAVSVYDQRRLSKSGAPMQVFMVQDKKMPDRHITASLYNYCGSEIVASYNDDDIYLFDTTAPGSNYVHCYQGHRNGATIKGVLFFGPRSEYVVSGSDCGNIFFWDKSSQGIVQFLLADKGVVNCLEGHPSMPILASSGLDNDVKVWLPSREEPNKMEDLLKTVTGNLRIRNMNGHDPGDSRMMWMLWRVIQGAQRNTGRRARTDSNSDDRGEGDHHSGVSQPGSDTNSSDSEHDGNVECFPS